MFLVIVWESFFSLQTWVKKQESEGNWPFEYTEKIKLFLKILKKKGRKMRFKKMVSSTNQKYENLKNILFLFLCAMCI